MKRYLADERNDIFTSLLPYVLIALIFVFGSVGHFTARNEQKTSQLLTRQEAAERVAFEQCRSDNDTRLLVAEVLDTIAAPQREGESMTAYNARIEVFEEAKKLLILNECPQAPGPVTPGG